MNTNIYIYANQGTDNVLYNSIKDTVTGKCCFPDILINHGFTEDSICDKELYLKAESAMKQYGSSNCFFITYKDPESYIDFLKVINNVYPVTPTEYHDVLINDFGKDMLFSATMMSSLRTLLNYYCVKGGDLINYIGTFSAEHNLPVTTKNEGKELYELLKQEILG